MTEPRCTTLKRHPDFRHFFFPEVRFVVPPDARPIPGFPEYMVSPAGIIYDISGPHAKPSRPISHSINSLSYVKAALRDGQGGRKFVSVHRMVALAFIPNPNPESAPHVDHIDRNTINNRPDNLQWVSHAENLRLARLRIGSWNIKGDPRTCTKVTAYTIGNNLKRASEIKFPSLAAATDHFKKKYATFAAQICRAINNGWLCEGHLWERS